MFISDVFSDSELTVIHNDLEQALKEPGWNNWNDITGLLKNHDTSAYETYPSEQGNITFKYIEGAVKTLLRLKLIQIDPATRGYDFKSYYQVWDQGAATGMHSDRQYLFNATFYLNKTWSPDAGGLYVYQDDNQYKVHVPQYNSCVYNNQGSIENHLVTPVTASAPEKRYTIHCKGMPIK